MVNITINSSIVTSNISNPPIHSRGSMEGALDQRLKIDKSQHKTILSVVHNGIPLRLLGDMH